MINSAESWKSIRASEASRKILARSNPEDFEAVSGWERPALAALLNQGTDQNTESVKLLFDAAAYYEAIGRADQSLRIGKLILDISVSTKNTDLQRRAHNSLGIFYSRVCDFSKSFLHVDKAFDLARMTQDPRYILATLSNAATVLYSAGLRESAKQVALKASYLPATDGLMRYLHLINSNNGLLFSGSVSDGGTADHFYNLAVKFFQSRDKVMTGVTRAYHNALTAGYLIAAGKVAPAVASLEKALSRASPEGNVRVLALLNCALASGYLQMGDLDRLAVCEESLLKLVPLTISLTDHHEEVLRTLIKIVAQRSTAEDKKREAQLIGSLREYILTTRHIQFFSNIARSFGRDLSSEVLRAPSIQVPGSLTRVSLHDHKASSGPVDARGIRPSSEWLWQAEGEPETLGCAFGVAEDWAIAAEFLSGGSWQHCFAVGELVRVMALHCEVDAHKAAELGLASRVRDIGKIATIEGLKERDNDVPLNEFGTTCIHTEVGARLLSGSSNPIFMLAREIARSHHEWWNGCGVPLGLAGEGIPLGGRLCAVADAFVALAQPSTETMGWDPVKACKQLATMAGVQLDPRLVAVVIGCLERDNGQLLNDICGRENGSGCNSLLVSRKRLFQTLEVA